MMRHDSRLHVTFVCMYNLARSVMAAAMFAHQIQQRGIDSVVRVGSDSATARVQMMAYST